VYSSDCACISSSDRVTYSWGDRAWGGLLIELEPGLQLCFEELTLMGQEFEPLVVAQALKLVG
jgi:hypothetical protein